MFTEQETTRNCVLRSRVAAPLLAALACSAGCLAPAPIDREAFLMAVPEDAGLGRVELAFTEDQTLERIWVERSGGSLASNATRDLTRLLAGLGALLEASMPTEESNPTLAEALAPVAASKGS